ncbi:MAG: Wzz/FepE/Etk N-terminal domain-containing protein [Actinomycetes bacterium]
MDQVSGQQGAATLGEYGGAFRRRWWVVALGAVFGLALAAVYLLIVPKTYIATAAVKVEPIGGSADNAVTDARTNSGVNLDTEAQLVTSQAVSAEAKVALQSPEIVGQLVQHVSVSVPPNTNVLRISYSADTPEAARLGASAYANGYLKNRRDTAVDSLDTQERALKQQIEELQTQLDAATPEERDGIQTTLQAVRLRLGQVVGTPVEPGEIISDALLPRRPASPNAALVLASGLAFGLLIGLSGLYLLERRDGRCYDWRTVERRLGLAVLADIPGEPGEPAPLFEPHSMGAESFAELRNALMSGLGDDPATLVVATPSAGIGADVVAANLAVTLARSGHSTTVVIADEESAIPMLFGLPATEGLAEFLRGRVELHSALQAWPDLPALKVMSAGHGLHTEVLDFEASGINELLEALTERSHYVIIRARSSDEAADAQYFGRFANAALPVIEVGRTGRDSIAAAVRQWKLVGTVVPGAVTLPAFDAPEPPPPRAVTSPTGEASPEPRPALSTKKSEHPPQPSSNESRPRSKDGATDDKSKAESGEPLRKAPPQR